MAGAVSEGEEGVNTNPWPMTVTECLSFDNELNIEIIVDSALNCVKYIEQNSLTGLIFISTLAS